VKQLLYGYALLIVINILILPELPIVLLFGILEGLLLNVIDDD